MREGLFLLLALGVFAALWQWSARGRERVLAVSARVCEEMNMQRLDDSVALCGLRLVRQPGWAVERRYEFEFSPDGVERRRGQVFLSGMVLDRVHLDLPSGPLIVDIP